jgi:hypothetical protein
MYIYIILYIVYAHIFIYTYIYIYIQIEYKSTCLWFLLMWPPDRFRVRTVSPESFSRRDNSALVTHWDTSGTLGQSVAFQTSTVYGWNHRRAVHWFPIFYQWGDNLLLCQALRRQALVSFQLLLASGPCLKILMWRKKVRCRARVKSGGKGINMKTISW